MNKVKETIIYYNSSARNGNEPINNHTAFFPTNLFNFQHDEVGELEIVQFSTKMSYYNVSNTRNTRFTFTNGVTSSTITLTQGNYNIRELAIEIKTQLDLASSLVWTISLDMQTLKYSYYYTGTPSGDVIFTPISPYRTFELLGFNNSAKNMTSAISEGTAISSDNIVSIGNLESFFVHADLADSTHVNDTEATEHAHSNIFAEVPIITSGFGSQIYWEKMSDFTPKFKFPSVENANYLHFRIMDKYSNEIELTDNYNMTLVLKIYKTGETPLDKLVSLLTIKMLEKENRKV